MNIPQELNQRRQWMIWRDELGVKVPYQLSGARGKSNDAKCWASAEECINSGTHKTGIAFVLSADDPYCGVDLDGAITDSGYEPWAEEILAKLKGVCYCEISPSGKGLKLITKATKALDAKCTHKFGSEGKKQIECYDNRRFWTWTGRCIGVGFDKIGDGQEAIDWLTEKYLKGVVRATAGKRLEPAKEPAPLSLAIRAEAYSDSVPGASKGDLRNSAFRLAGHLHSLVGDMGERLSDSEVYNLLFRWNGRNTDKLRDDELREAAINGRKNGTPPADKLPEIKFTAVSEVDMSEFVIPDLIEGEPPRNDFPQECLSAPGIIEETIAYTLARSMYPQPELAMAGALAMLATITGRKIQSDYGTRTNCYFLGLAPSGAGKEQARKTNKELLTLAGAANLLGPERIASSAGLTSFVQTRLSPLFQLDEIGRLLGTMKNASKSPHLYNIGTVLMQLYSSSDQVWVGDAYADQKKTPTINQPHCVVYGTAVPDGFWDGMTKESISDGLLGRMMIFEAPGYVAKQRPKIVDPQPSLVDSVRWWVDYQPGGNMSIVNPQPATASHTDAARVRFEAHLDAIDDRKQHDTPEAAALWSRSGEKVAKLALLFAISRHRETEDIEIDLGDVNRAIKLANWLTRQMLFKSGLHVSSNDVEASRKKLLRVILDSGGKITMSHLTRRTQWLRRRERAEFMDELRESGEIDITSEDTNGRPVTWVTSKVGALN
jgi:hypothetical protein